MTPVTISAAGSGAAAGTPNAGALAGDVARNAADAAHIGGEAAHIAWEGVADAAARAAGVTVRTVHDVVGISAVADFFADVWQTPRVTPPYPSEVLHSLVHAGGAVHAAYCAGPSGERLAGAAVAVFGPPAERDVYSFVAAATASGRGVGFAVKQAQRLWALERGATTMRWTFDPLVSRNARFNLVKLGAVGSEYLVDFYGPMSDGVNNGDESDRLTVAWDLVTGTTRTDDPAEGRSAADAVRRAPDGGPLDLRDADRLWCRVPEDIVALRATDPALALDWRHAVREVFTEAYAEGLRATAMSRDGWYLLTRPSPDLPTVRTSAGTTVETSSQATSKIPSESASEEQE
ncbi:chorismate synthase [Streptomyces sp. 8N706]|uniref:chorismate synthase n=1 Tax=Streptomyces sp. 8N706 TaxID=3457416 RepID=UPI003FD03121